MKKRYFVYLLLILLLTSCKAKTYTVTFVDDGKELSSISIKKGDNLKNIAIPKKEGYIFLAWLKDGLEYDENRPVTEDITLSASWIQEPDIVKNHTITFNFGEFTKTQTVKDGEKAQKPSTNPVKEKHTFLGWYVGEELYDFETPVTKDITISAKFKKNRIIIKYDLNGGSGTKEVEIDESSIPNKPKDPTKFGYTFLGWILDGQPYNFDFPLNKDTTIKAVWEATIYVKVTFDTNGGDEIKSEMIPQNTSLTELPTPVKEGYTFKYWSYNNQEFSINTKIAEDITLIAIYEENE